MPTRKADQYKVTMYLSGEGKQIYDAIMELAGATGLSGSTILFMCFIRGWESVHAELTALPHPSDKSKSRVK